MASSPHEAAHVNDRMVYYGSLERRITDLEPSLGMLKLHNQISQI